MAYRVTWTKKAVKSLMTVDRRQRQIIASWVAENLDGSENPTVVGDCKKLKGVANGWRWRIGNYRVLGRLADGELVVEVFKVGHRGDVYERLPKR